MQISGNLVGMDLESMKMSKSGLGAVVSENNFDKILAGAEKNVITERIARKDKAPYSHLTENGVINYNGVTFICDDEKKQLCLGDVSDKSKCLSIPLSGGGTLVVNRDNLGELSKAIGMFSPEDVTRILRAITLDKKCEQKLKEIEDEKIAFSDVVS